MRKRDARPSAADHLAEQPPCFATPTSFAKVFPQLSNSRIDVTRARRGCGPPQSLVFKPHNPQGEYAVCTNSLCYGGGFAIVALLREMAQKRQAVHESFLFCLGYEGSPKGHVRYRDCGGEVAVRARLTVREGEVSVPG